MWLLSFRDLQWRRRRFVTAVLATAVVFAMALIMTGMSASFGNEARRTVDAFGADAWVVPKDATGPMTAPVAFLADEAKFNEPLVHAGVTKAGMVGVGSGILEDGTKVNLLGVVAGSFPAPPALGPGSDAVVDDALGFQVGDSVTVSGISLRVAGIEHGISYYAGQPAMFVPLDVVSRLSFGGQPLATMIATKGVPTSAPDGFRVATNQELVDDLLKPVAQASQSIAMMKLLLWAVAAGIIASILYMTAVERLRDFAVLKATGAKSRDLFFGMVLQAVILSLAAAVLSVGIAFVLKPGFAMSVEIPWTAYVLLPVVALVVGAIASAAGVRRAVRVDPALAFG